MASSRTPFRYLLDNDCMPRLVLPLHAYSHKTALQLRALLTAGLMFSLVTPITFLYWEFLLALRAY